MLTSFSFVINEKALIFSSPYCTVILEKSRLLRSSLAGVPVLNLRISIPLSKRLLVSKAALAKPDWAFIEEGLPVPKPGDPSRFERGVLGDYALRMADGYLLHGTLYQRFLGMPVTHGCIRLGDADLEVVYHTLPVGAYVYIY